MRHSNHRNAVRSLNTASIAVFLQDGRCISADRIEVVISELQMVDVMSLYLDDSGTHYPDRDPGQEAAHGRDWFGLGGVILRDRDVELLRARHRELCTKWRITSPLHSCEIRPKVQNFRWLRKCTDIERAEFFDDIGRLVTGAELTATACVIDRPGYNHRYREKYGRARWSLCKTAFTVVVERSAKFARDNGCLLRIYVEKSDKKTDRTLLGYYDELRNTGHPFDVASASKYSPLTAAELRETLYEFKTKEKSSPLMQIADVSFGRCASAATPPTTARTSPSERPEP